MPEQTTGFVHGELQLFSHLHELLEQEVSSSKSNEIIDALRDRLLDEPKKDAGKARGLLEASITACRVCQGVKPDPTPGHWNLTDPDLVLVTTTPLEDTGNNELILKALKNSGFSSKRVGAISVVRCVPEGLSPDEEHVSNCTDRYLFRQIQLLRPGLIMGFGALPSSVLLNDPQFKVTENIGQVFWVGPWPVLTTISAGYASHHPAREEAFEDSFATAHRFLYNKAQTHE